MAYYLNKDRFEVWTMLYPKGNLPITSEFQHVHFIQCIRPRRIGQYIAYIRGIFCCDIAYLPKCELTNFLAIILHLLHKKSFLTIEGVIDKSNYTKMIQKFGSEQKIRKIYSSFDRAYAISQYIQKANKEKLNIHSDGILYLGVDTRLFSPQSRPNTSQSFSIAFIGNNMRYKGINEILQLAGIFPNIPFHIIGAGMGYNVSKEIATKNLKNIVYHGILTHEEIITILNKVSLHVFPSRSEGFPKVILETAAVGVPSIVYSDYGAQEWITSGESGYVLNTFEEIVNIVTKLQNDPIKMSRLSVGAIKMAHNFDWRIVIKKWEDEIEKLYNMM